MSTKIFPTAANNDLKLHPSVRDIVKLASFTHSMEDLSLSPQCPSNNQFRNPICLITRQIKYIT